MFNCQRCASGMTDEQSRLVQPLELGIVEAPKEDLDLVKGNWHLWPTVRHPSCVRARRIEPFGTRRVSRKAN